jgi:hypothetical protein
MQHVGAIAAMCNKTLEDFLGKESYRFYKKHFSDAKVAKQDRTNARHKRKFFKNRKNFDKEKSLKLMKSKSNKNV